MTFREKTAWIMSLALLLGGLFYGRTVWSGTQEVGEIMPPLIPVIVIYVIILVVVAIIGHVGAAIITPGDANEARDERERQIMVRSSSLGSHLFGLGVLLSLGAYLVSYDGNALFHGVFASLMIGQLAEYVLQIIFFRKTAGGLTVSDGPH